jgi:hypothetical protein
MQRSGYGASSQLGDADRSWISWTCLKAAAERAKLDAHGFWLLGTMAAPLLTAFSFRFLALASGPGVRRILAHGQPDALRPLAPFQVVGPIGVALGRSVRQQPHRGACGRWPRGRPGSGAFSCWFGLALVTLH